ncbi:MAG: hypothetical protein ACHQE5_06835 [Actinomycetes bacterium]
MKIPKRAASIGLSATLLASLFATVAAPAALGAVTVTPVGVVPVGGTSVGAATFNFTESSAGAFANGPGSFDVWIGDSSDTPPLVTDLVGTASHVGFSGTPSVSGSPASLGASATLVGTGTAAVLRVSITASDVFNIEPIIVSALKIFAQGPSVATVDAAHPTGAAVTGAMQAQLFNFTGSITIADLQSGGTASGQLDVNYPIGTGAVTVNVTTTGCLFVATGTGSPAAGNAVFSSNAESIVIDAVAAGVVANQQVLTLDVNTAAVHTANEIVTQANACAPNGVIGSPGSVGNALAYSSAGNPNVFAGESNAPAANLTVVEPVAGFLPTGAVVTFTIKTAGVVFSTRPIADASDVGNILLVDPSAATGQDDIAPMTLSADRTAATFTVGTASTVRSTILIDNIKYDLAATVPGGTFIDVQVTVSGALLVLPTDNTNAVVNRGITATATPTPVVIGQNSQKSGLVTLTELQAGFFQGGTGANNVIEVCLFGRENFTSPGPWAKVSAGDLRLREGAVASPDNIVQGSPFFFGAIGDTCYFWVVWTPSTAISTILIGNSDFTSGPLIDVPADATPGPVNMDIFIGDTSVLTDESPSATVQIATKAFANQVAVTALSQPTIPAGSADAKAGNIQVAETAVGQLKDGEEICVEVQPRTSNEAIQDTYLKALNTSDIPLATASGGVAISPVTMSTSPCEDNQGPGNKAAQVTVTHTVSFSFTVEQQSTAGTGKVVISNIHYITTADAPSGNVLVNVFGLGGSPTFVEFQSTISNARIGRIAFKVATALGATKLGPFSSATKVAKPGKYITWRFAGGSGLAGQHVFVYISVKGSTQWGAFTLVTSRIADANGNVYYWIRYPSNKWVSVRVLYGADPANQIWSSATQGRWMK